MFCPRLSLHQGYGMELGTVFLGHVAALAVVLPVQPWDLQSSSMPSEGPWLCSQGPPPPLPFKGAMDTQPGQVLPGRTRDKELVLGMCVVGTDWAWCWGLCWALAARLHPEAQDFSDGQCSWPAPGSPSPFWVALSPFLGGAGFPLSPLDSSECPPDGSGSLSGWPWVPLSLWVVWGPFLGGPSSLRGGRGCPSGWSWVSWAPSCLVLQDASLSRVPHQVGSLPPPTSSCSPTPTPGRPEPLPFASLGLGVKPNPRQ